MWWGVPVCGGDSHSGGGCLSVVVGGPIWWWLYMSTSGSNKFYENCHYLLDRQRFIVYIIIRRCELVQHKGDQKWESNGQ